MKDRTGQILFGALANQIRCQILKELESGEKCVNDLVRVLKIKQSLVSHNLKILIKAGLVQVRRSGTFRYYTANKPMTAAAFDLLAKWEAGRAGEARHEPLAAYLPATKNSHLHFFKLDKDGVVLASQGTGFEDMGFTRGSHIGQHFSRSIEDMPEVIEAVNAGLSGQVIHKDVTGRGRIFGLRVLPLIEKDGRPNGCVGVVYDITDRLEMMWQSRAAEGRWKALMASVPHHAALIDAAGRIVHLNRAPSKIPLEKAIGMSIYDWFGKAQHKTIDDALRFVTETGESKQLELASSGEMDGRAITYKAVLSPVHNNGSKPKELIVIFGKSTEGGCLKG